MGNGSSSFRYVILGAGRQGTAAAHDLARFGEAGRIILADVDPQAARQAAGRVNRLARREVAESRQLNVTDPDALREVLTGADGTLSAVPYYYNLDITRAAVEAGSHLCDLGGNTDVVKAQLALDEEAKQAGVSIVPDCGMGPGLNNTVGVYAIELLDEAHEVYVYDGGLPQNPRPPWNYQITFHVNGLTNEYHGKAVVIRDGRIAEIEALSEYELIDWPPLGTLEAFAGGGSTSTVPWTYEGKLDRYECKIVRYPGHCEWFRAFKTLGLFAEEPIQVGDQTVVPREVYHALLEPHITAPLIKDLCLIRARAVGMKDGRETTVVVDLIDYYDEETGFTSMERLTGWHAAIMLGFQVRGDVRAGGVAMEMAVPASRFMEEVRKRGISFDIRYEGPHPG